MTTNEQDIVIARELAASIEKCVQQGAQTEGCTPMLKARLLRLVPRLISLINEIPLEDDLFSLATSASEEEEVELKFNDPPSAASAEAEDPLSDEEEYSVRSLQSDEEEDVIAVVRGFKKEVLSFVANERGLERSRAYFNQLVELRHEVDSIDPSNQLRRLARLSDDAAIKHLFCDEVVDEEEIKPRKRKRLFIDDEAEEA